MNISGLVNKTRVFLKEVRLEIKKINWPTRQETVKYTLIVISVSLTVAAFLGGLDYIFSSALKLILFR